MFVRAMDICWHQMILIIKSIYLTNGNQQLSKRSIALIQVIIEHFNFSLTNFDLIYVSTNEILDDINCVRWGPNGNMLASASDDKTMKLLDFKTEKVLYTGTTSDGSKYIAVIISSPF